MGEEQRVCKRCLLREMADQTKVYETVKQYIEDIEPGDRAPEGIYNLRLTHCKACERLLDGMCRACGCYVELRAARANNGCPYGNWDSD